MILNKISNKGISPFNNFLFKSEDIFKYLIQFSVKKYNLSGVRQFLL